MNPTKQQRWQHLLEMIEPTEDYTGGSVSYETAKEMYDYITKLEAVVWEARGVLTYVIQERTGQALELELALTALEGEG